MMPCAVEERLAAKTEYLIAWFSFKVGGSEKLPL